MNWESVVGFCAVTGILLIYFTEIKPAIIRHKTKREIATENQRHLEAEILSKKLRDSRVEIGVRTPSTFKTKRKPQICLKKA